MRVVPNDHYELRCVAADNPTDGTRGKYGAAWKFDGIEVRVGDAVGRVASFGKAINYGMGSGTKGGGYQLGVCVEMLQITENVESTVPAQLA